MSRFLLVIPPAADIQEALAAPAGRRFPAARALPTYSTAQIIRQFFE